MFKAVSKALAIAVMLVAFVGQAIAFNSAMPCETSEDSLSIHSSELEQSASSHSTDLDSEDDCCGIDCCDGGCSCITNACTSFVYFNTEIDSTKTIMLSGNVYILQSKQPTSLPTLLYRPPISTS